MVRSKRCQSQGAVLIVSPYAIGQIGGGQEKVGRALVDYMRERLCAYHIRIPHYKEHNRLGRLIVSFSIFVETASLCLIKNIKVVHIFSPCNRSGFYEKLLLSLLVRILGKNSILNFRGAFDFYYHQWSKTEQRIIKRLLSFSTIVLCQHSQLKNFLVSEGLVPNEHAAQVIPNGIDEDEFSNINFKVPQNNQRIKIIFLGAFGPAKGVDVLIKAVHRLRETVGPELPSFQLNLYGPPYSEKHLQELEELVRLYQLDKQVYLLPPIHGDDKRTALEEADIFVLPSRTEGFPNGLLEAMLMALPVVASDVGAVPEIISHGENGLIFPSQNVAVLASFLEKLIKDPHLRASLGEAACARVLRCYDNKEVLPKFERLYRQVFTTS